MLTEKPTGKFCQHKQLVSNENSVLYTLTTTVDREKPKGWRDKQSLILLDF